MKRKNITYVLLVDGKSLRGIRSATEARRRIRSLTAKGFRVICDRETITKSCQLTERVFRNDPQFPLNTIGA